MLQLATKPPAGGAAPGGSPTPAADMTAAMSPARFGTSNLRMSRVSCAVTARSCDALTRRDLLVRVTARHHVDDLGLLGR